MIDFHFWANGVIKPYIDFIMDHYQAATLFTTFFVSLLLGVFYKTDKDDSYELQWGIPILVILLSSLTFPLLSIFILMLLPFIVGICLLVGSGVGFFSLIRKAREKALLKALERRIDEKKLP